MAARQSTLTHNGVIYHHFDNNYSEPSLTLGELNVLQIGDLHCAPGYHVMPHEQWCHEISYVEHGAALFRNNSDWYTLGAGQLFIGLKGSVHDVLAVGPNSMRMFYMGFEENRPSALDDVVEAWKELGSPAAMDTFGVRGVFLQAFAEYMSEKCFSMLMMKSLVTQLIVLATRCAKGVLASPYHPMFGEKKEAQLVSRMLAEIEQHYLEIQDLRSFADELGYSYSHISHIFTEYMGISISGYLSQRRFEQAKQWLADGKSVTGVSQMLGYQSIHAFSKAFKKRFDISPSKYQGRV